MPDRLSPALLAAGLSALGCSSGDAAAPADAPIAALGPGSADLETVAARDFCVTSGRVQALGADAVRVDVGGMRGVAARAFARSAEMAFAYHGASRDVAPLASGELRRQIGLKLRAQDTCNVIYVMWHAEPTPGVFVSVKRNPGKSTHAECGAGGYLNLAPRARTQSPEMTRDGVHVMRADLDGRTLRVLADGVLVWEGDLPDAAFEFDGPAGVRADNGVFDFALRLPRGAGPRLACPAPDGD